MTIRDKFPEVDRDRLYESAKQAWIATHPDASPEEYQAAMRRIADECGV